MVSWLMTLKVDFLLFDGHLSFIEVKTQNAVTPQLFKNKLKDLSKLHEIKAF